MSIGRMLTGHELFRSFLPEQIEKISRFASARSLEKGEVIYRPEKKATHVFVLLEGDVQLRLPAPMGEMSMVVARVGKGELFGIAPLLRADRYTTTAQCLKASKVMFVEARPFLQMLEDNPLIGHQLMTFVARAYFDRYRIMVERVQKILTELEFAE
jgi:CRP-like cAMP-binding protein